ncbi:MAG: transketolase [Candidatus Micrarchaeota archaeon]|nr:transketolase [Candidatus Micrarchaeota archaeon]MDE1834471.1 transketolase [Candidatus Micrarchaeota archaeon]MDE1859393.1 transketolase [Candidatus Micrarchaeota archaeon]
MGESEFIKPDRKPSIEELKGIASQVREGIINELSEAKSGHVGGSLSCTDILVALYFQKMAHNPKNPKWPERDRLLLSKGHAAPALYSTLAAAGYFPKEELKTLRKINTRLQGHPDPTKLPGVEIPGGPEGIGLSEGIGMALAARIDKKSHKIFVIMGDGELDEGEVWEAAMAASKFKLDNITVIIDKNGLQQEGRTMDIMPTDSVAAKFKAFNWNVIETNGNDMSAVLAALDQASQGKGMPTAIVASTLKGKGVDFMEGKVEYHAKVLTTEAAESAIKQIKSSR